MLTLLSGYKHFSEGILLEEILLLFLSRKELIAGISLWKNARKLLKDKNYMMLKHHEFLVQHIPSKPEPHTMANGKAVFVMAKVSKSGQMAPYIKVTGKITVHMDKVNLLILMVIYILVPGFTIKQMAMVYIIMLTELSMRASGKKIFNKEKEKKAGLMDRNT